MLSDEYRYKILNLLEKDPELSQRDVARALGVSLGKVNFCIRALIDKGLVKARNFRNNKHKRAYMYYLTPTGFEEKARVTASFLRVKMNEYEALTQEIERLRGEVVKDGSAPKTSAHG